MAGISFPGTAYGSIFSIFSGIFGSAEARSASPVNEVVSNSQNMALLKAAVNINPDPVKSNSEPTIVDNSSILPETDFSANTNTPKVFDSAQITIYVVRSGDTLPQIAKVFGVTTKTIMIANDMASAKLVEGQRLIILPVSGIQHTVRKGETIQGLALAYKVGVDDILEYNHFENVSLIAVGDEIFIPSDSLPTNSKPSSKGSTTQPVLSSPLIGKAVSQTQKLVDATGFFAKPLAHYVKTQGLHGHNGVDLGSSIGETIMAAAAGEVVISRMGWNGGYGNYIMIQHSNGTQTVYAHASKLLVSEGDVVEKGQAIALVGSSGRSTGSHLHFEVRGAKNPF